MKSYILTLLTVCFVFSLGYSQSITGDWHAWVELPDRQYRLIVHVNTSEAGYAGTADNQDDQSIASPLQQISISKDKVNFKIVTGEEFDGRFSIESQTIIGQWTVGNNSAQIIFGREEIGIPEESFVTIKELYNKEEFNIPMRDGKRLFTSVYSPKDGEKAYPILIWRTPYNSEPREDHYTDRLMNNIHLLKEGYIIVYQDVRGRYLSEGDFVDVRPYLQKKHGKEVDENSDIFDTIDWLIKNLENHNGKVGIYGISYPGFYSSMSLPDAHPALKAVSPQAPVTEWFIGDDFHHNGAFFLLDAFNFYSNFGRPRPEPTREFPTQFQYINEDNYDLFMDLGPIKNVREKYFGDTIRFWSDLMTHPDYDDFWKDRNILQHLKNIKPAVLVVGGWFDAEDLYGTLKTYKTIENQNVKNNQNRLIMGPWSHGQWSSEKGDKLGNIHFDANTSEFFKEVELKFFNFYLKGIGTMDLPEASIFITGSNEWREFNSWPPTNIEKRMLFFQEDHKLSFSKPIILNGFNEYVSDPGKPVPYTEDVHLTRTREYLTDDQRFASRRPDVMVYQTEVLEEDLTLAGPIIANLFVSTTGTDADYVIKLIDVFPEQMDDYPKNESNVPMGGYQMLVRGEVFRGKYRNSFENPEPFVPNAVTDVSFEIPDVAHTFIKGHRIMIQIQNSWFPLVDRNPQQFLNIYECDEDDFIKASHRIYHDMPRPSNISVSILKNTE